MRAEVRRAYRCPCDGTSHLVSARALTRRTATVDGQLDAIEATTGDRPDACPWWAFHEADVGVVLRLHDAIAGDGGSDELLHQLWGDDPPWWQVLGLAHYRRVLGHVRAESLRLEREARKAEQRRGRPMLPSGHEVEHEIRR